MSATDNMSLVKLVNNTVKVFLEGVKSQTKKNTDTFDRRYPSSIFEVKPKKSTASKTKDAAPKADDADKVNKIVYKSLNPKTNELVTKEIKLPRKVISTNAQFKRILSFILKNLIEETQETLKTLDGKNGNIKEAIINHSLTNSEYSVSALVFAFSAYSKDIIEEVYNSVNINTIRSLFDKTLRPTIPDGTVLNIVIESYIHFVKVLAIEISNSVWYDAKLIKDDEKNTEIYVGVSKTISDTHVLKVLLTESAKLLRQEDRYGDSFHIEYREFCEESVRQEAEMKKEGNVRVKKEAVKRVKKENDDDKKKRVEEATRVESESESESDSDSDSSDSDSGSDSDSDSDSESKKKKSRAKAPVKEVAKSRRKK
jgi:hypothetical protein